MIGVEMVEDKVTKVPLRPQAMLDIWDRTKEAGVLIGECYTSYTFNAAYVIFYVV
jgi:hypothetical protein